MLFKLSYILVALVATTIALPLEVRQSVGNQIRDLQAEDNDLYLRDFDEMLLASGDYLEERGGITRFTNKAKAKVLGAVGTFVQEVKNRVRKKGALPKARRVKNGQRVPLITPSRTPSPPQHARSLDTTLADDELLLEARDILKAIKKQVTRPAKQIKKVTSKIKTAGLEKLATAQHWAQNKVRPHRPMAVKTGDPQKTAEFRAGPGLSEEIPHRKREMEPFDLEYRELEDIDVEQRGWDEDDMLDTRAEWDEDDMLDLRAEVDELDFE